MKVKLPAGRYGVAVSGGVDSMVLLDILSRQSDLDLIVAHFNHGIRSDSSKDETLVRQAAVKYRLPFEAGHGKIGATASEEVAREARYAFLNKTKRQHKAEAIVTAHHQDDLIETAILNIFRGTGRRGLSSIADNPNVLRPLLKVSKGSVLEYAKSHKLEWLEDPTNRDDKYLRNYIRLQIIPRLSDHQRKQLVQGLDNVALINQWANQEIAKLSQVIVKNKIIHRNSFISLPRLISCEILMYFLRQHNIYHFDQKLIERLSLAIKTAKPGTRHDIVSGAVLEIYQSEARFMIKK